MNNLAIINGSNLSGDQLKQINTAFLREFKHALPSIEKLIGRVFFLLQARDKILAMGQLLPIEPVVFNNETFSLLGIGGIIANEKGKGFGKQIITAIRDYLKLHDKTGLGFCEPKNQGFYEKSGLSVNSTSIKQFIYRRGGKDITDQAGHYIIYQNSSDHFMKKVLLNTDKEILIPTPPTW